MVDFPNKPRRYKKVSLYRLDTGTIVNEILAPLGEDSVYFWRRIADAVAYWAECDPDDVSTESDLDGNEYATVRGERCLIMEIQLGE